MEFTYTLTEVEYLRASKPGRAASSRSVPKMVMFWVFVLVCLMLLFAVIQKRQQQAGAPDQTTVTQPSNIEPRDQATFTRSLIVNVGPFLLLGGIWIFLVVRIGPMRRRRIYRKDPFMQGQFTVNISPESISIRNTAGTTSQTGWNIYDRWREGKNLIILALHSGACFAMSLENLSGAQRDELRGILSTALPVK